MTATLNFPSALALNADFTPLSVLPLSLLSWTDSVKEVIAGRVTLVAEYDIPIRAQKMAMKLPGVVALKKYDTGAYGAAFTRRAIWIRDGFTCQYCGQRFPMSELTFDHVLPRSRGGSTSFRNIVTACGPDNLRKRDRTPEEAGMALLRKPYVPTKLQLARLGAKLGPQNGQRFYREWLDFLPTDQWKGRFEIIEAKSPLRETAGQAFPDGMTSEEYFSAPLESD